MISYVLYMVYILNYNTKHWQQVDTLGKMNMNMNIIPKYLSRFFPLWSPAATILRKNFYIFN